MLELFLDSSGDDLIQTGQPMKPIRCILFACLLPTAYCLLLTGCGPTKDERKAHYAIEDYRLADYGHATEVLRPLANKTDENYVLNNARLGSSALAGYDLDTAESAFLNAYEVINSTGTNSGGRGAAAAIFSEKMKVWKGEPFEKAMVNFYLGVIYYMQHDYENARAAFENSLFKLRDYGESKNKDDQYRKVESDFVIGYIMLAKCFQRMGDEQNALKNFNRAVELRRNIGSLADPRRNFESNVLLVVDFGQGPRRVTNPYDGAFVGFGPKPFEVGSIPIPRVIIGNQVAVGPRSGDMAAMPTIDLLSLAQEKRWQDIDTIRAVKDVVGTGLIAAGGYEAYRASNSTGSEQRRDATAAIALIGAGALLKASSQADTRTWEMLPRTVFLIPLRLPPGRHDITVDFPEISGLHQTWRGLVVPDRGEATYYVRIQRHSAGPYDWPPAAMSQKAPAPTQGTPGAPGAPAPRNPFDPPSGPSSAAPLPGGTAGR